MSFYVARCFSYFKLPYSIIWMHFIMSPALSSTVHCSSIFFLCSLRWVDCTEAYGVHSFLLRTRFLLLKFYPIAHQPIHDMNGIGMYFIIPLALERFSTRPKNPLSLSLSSHPLMQADLVINYFTVNWLHFIQLALERLSLAKLRTPLILGSPFYIAFDGYTVMLLLQGL